MSKIVLTGGGTAGHVVPGLALIPHLKKRFDEFYYIGSHEGMEKRLLEGYGITYFSVDTAKLARKMTVKNLAIPVKVINGYRKAKKILSEIKPDVVFSKGGYVAVPVVFAAHSLGIPIISHESDLSIGLANRIAAPKSKKVLTSFPETAKLLKNAEYSGCPIRDELFNTDRVTALQKYGFNGTKPIILVLGGSQGSATVNRCVEKAESELLPKFDILQICGKGNLPSTAPQNGRVCIEYENEMAFAYAAADLAITRAGANTLFELFALKIPSVVIPLKKGSSRGDQIENAEYFYTKGLVTMIYEHNLTPESLTTAISSAYADRFNFRRRLNSYNINDASPFISDLLAEFIN